MINASRAIATPVVVQLYALLYRAGVIEVRS